MASKTQTGFVHSTPVPKIYRIASKVAKNVKDGRDSLKNLIYAEKHANIKILYALVVEAFKRSELIDELIQKSGLLVNEPRFNPWLAKILISELLWGKKKMCRGSKPIETIFRYEEVLRKALEDCTQSIQPVLKHNISKPRYVRVNNLKITTEEAVINFKEEGWRFVAFFDKSDYSGYQNLLMNLKPDEFMKDIHIPSLLIFPPKTEFYQHEAYKSGSIILQDKASCLPVHLLAPPPGSIVLDTCAAPGMKTTQIAALLNNEGTVYAVELNLRRERLLKELVESVGATCVKTILKDVMQVTSDDCPDVEYILVDPSCSGSGITDRVEIEKLDLNTKMARLKKLCNFQAKLLRYTMTAYPKAKRIVYSTCSVNSEENEDVVRQTLETSRNFKLVDARKSLQSWNTKTSEVYPELGNMCIYATPEEDKTNGFFVAVFERLQEGERNPYLNYELCKFFDKESKRNNRFNKFQDVNELENQKESWNDNTMDSYNHCSESSIKNHKDGKRKHSMDNFSNQTGFASTKEKKNRNKEFYSNENKDFYNNKSNFEDESQAQILNENEEEHLESNNYGKSSEQNQSFPHKKRKHSNETVQSETILETTGTEEIHSSKKKKKKGKSLNQSFQKENGIQESNIDSKHEKRSKRIESLEVLSDNKSIARKKEKNKDEDNFQQLEISEESKTKKRKKNKDYDEQNHENDDEIHEELGRSPISKSKKRKIILSDNIKDSKGSEDENDNVETKSKKKHRKADEVNENEKMDEFETESDINDRTRKKKKTKNHEINAEIEVNLDQETLTTPKKKKKTCDVSEEKSKNSEENRNTLGDKNDNIETKKKKHKKLDEVNENKVKDELETESDPQKKPRKKNKDKNVEDTNLEICVENNLDQERITKPKKKKTTTDVVDDSKNESEEIDVPQHIEKVKSKTKKSKRESM